MYYISVFIQERLIEKLTLVMQARTLLLTPELRLMKEILSIVQKRVWFEYQVAPTPVRPFMASIMKTTYIVHGSLHVT